MREKTISVITLFAATSQQYFSLTPNQHQPPVSQSVVFFSHNKSTPATSHGQPNRMNMCMSRLPRPYDSMCVIFKKKYLAFEHPKYTDQTSTAR